ncbi:sulfoxide reductase heme-binding subunit YedZ [Candidatus Endobugula sertula]|uniref:Protein-methionine-sulfoxide reductase heme-binding subunit MsrQ n=1 Tax=Candidatus Endobugula sertula TaxID=62101 RepID=A0A1D2QMF6_9GAMM|nr:sulfoxide reductase heme-binding subunit YedZ [Candidatus Endobugula sertula]
MLKGVFVNGVGIAKSLVLLVCFLHVCYLIVGVLQGYLGANPIESLTHTTGEWGLFFLWLALSITPLRRLFHWNFLVHFRRMLGLCSFVYITAHFSIFIVFDHFFFLPSILEDIIERPYISVGFLAFVLMIPLAITSWSVIQRKLGRYWKRLHQSVYVVAILGVIHYWWLVKADILSPLLYGMVLLVLLGVRAYFFYRKNIRV